MMPLQAVYSIMAAINRGDSRRQEKSKCLQVLRIKQNALISNKSCKIDQIFYFFLASGPVVLVKCARDLLNLYYNSYSIEKRSKLAQQDTENESLCPSKRLLRQ